MADMCGPSNGLSTFQKHTTLDRTLQQDRIISRQSPAQGFRSSGPNARQLDPEFEAFQAGNLPLDSQGFQQPPFFPPPQAFQSTPGPVNWASDFQRMNISSPQLQANHGYTGQPLQRNMNGAMDWDQEFSRQQSQNIESGAIQEQPLHNGHMQQYNPRMGMGMNQYTNFQGPQENYQVQQPIEQFDDEAFERAFQDAASAQENIHQEISEEILQEQTDTQLQDTEDPFEDLMSYHSLSTPLENKPLDQPLLGADTIHDPNKPEEQIQKEDPGALARTAQQLIHNLSGDTRSKMQESEFMKLMRGFAAGTQVVRGDDVVGLDGKSQSEGVLKGESLKIALQTLQIVLDSLLLTPSRPFLRTPSKVRTLLLALLHINSILYHSKVISSSPPQPTHETQLGTTHTEQEARKIQQFYELKQTIEKVICSNHLNGIPSMRILAIVILKQLQRLGENFTEEEARNVHFEFLESRDTSKGNYADTQILRDVTTANEEIILPLTFMAAQLAEGKEETNTENEKDEEFETFAKDFEGRGREMLGLMERHEGRLGGSAREFVERWLGYEISLRYLEGQEGGAERAVGKVHLQRLRDILGPVLS